MTLGMREPKCERGPEEEAEEDADQSLSASEGDSMDQAQNHEQPPEFTMEAPESPPLPAQGHAADRLETGEWVADK